MDSDKFTKSLNLVNTNTFQLNDEVIFLGGNIYTNSDDDTILTNIEKQYTAKVVMKYYRGEHPYKILILNDKIVVSGWVDCNSLSTL